MATQSELTEIAVLQEQGRQMRNDISDIKDDVKSIVTKLDNLDIKYPTRREVNVLKWVVTFLAAAVAAAGSMILALWGHVK